MFISKTQLKSSASAFSFIIRQKHLWPIRSEAVDKNDTKWKHMKVWALEMAIYNVKKNEHY